MTKNKIKNIFVFLSIIVICLLTVVLINNGNEYIQARKEFDKQKEKLIEAENEIAQIKNKIALYEKEKKEFEEYLFKEQDIPAFLDNISRMAKESTVNIKDMKTKSFRAVRSSVSSNKAKSRVRKNRKNRQQQQLDNERQLKKMLTLAAMPIKMNVEGEFESLLKFFSTLEDFKQLVTISNVEIVSGKSYPILKCEYTLKIYSLKTLSEIETK